MENEHYGRDATCPAESGTVQGKTARAGDGIVESGTGERSPGLMAIRRVLWRIPPVHAGKLFLAGMKPGLPVRLVKRIDQFAMKIIHGGLRRYCL